MLCICKSDLFPDGRQIQREILYRPISCRTALLLHGASDLIDQSLAIVADSDLFAAQILLLIMLRLCQVAAGGEECKAACKTGSSKKKNGLGLTDCKLCDSYPSILLALQRAVVGERPMGRTIYGQTSRSLHAARHGVVVVQLLLLHARRTHGRRVGGGHGCLIV